MNSKPEDLGGKGAALQRLQAGGFNVPPFVVLPQSFFTAGDTEQTGPAEIAAKCRSHLGAWTELLGPGPFAVRSSAPVEDSEAHSFAGQFRTLLNVPAAALPEAVAEVYASTGTSAAYAHAAGITAAGGMAVIIQVMVEAIAAGVAFSVHPVQGTDQVVINAVRGLGDKLVDGSSNADTYEVGRDEPVTSSLMDTDAVLSRQQVLEVAALARQAHDYFGRPQDIEYAFQNETLFILQSRPVTTLPAQATIWDNSNIVESYPGLTLPLTFTFIEKMYESVYRQFTSILGVPQHKIERHRTALSSMLGLLNGRVYYNLNSWYEALALLPGYSLNAEFMERMMGVKDKPRISVAADTESRLEAWWNVARGIGGILKNRRTARRQASYFVEVFDQLYKPFAAKNYSGMSLAAIWADYVRFEQLMLREWKAPLVNDFFAMIYFGLLQKQCARLAPEDPNLHNRLLSGSDAVLTTAPMRELPKVAAAIHAIPELRSVAIQGSAAELVAALNQPQHEPAGRLFRAYIETWGERSVAELKLETITYRQDPTLLAGLLQSYIKAGSFESPRPAATPGEAAAAERYMAGKLQKSWLQRRLFRHILKGARYFVAQRENLRYYRTRGFGMVRRMTLAIGDKLAQSGRIRHPRDVFWLNLDEVGALASGEEARPMQDTIARRQEEYRAFEQTALPQRVEIWGKPARLIGMNAKAAPLSGSGALQGLPCSAGRVRTRVRLVTYADELRSLDGAILATYATDPGFVVLFASASGIITERGSLLSHAAIVSREMGIPCIVGIEGLMAQLRDGDLIEMDGSTGVVTRVTE